MAIHHNFHTPRNLFEKLIREAEQLEATISGDNVLNFMLTVNHLPEWISKSPMSKNEVVKRFQKRLASDPNVKLCQNIVNGTMPFSVVLDSSKCSAKLKVDDEQYDILKFKDEIMDLFSVYFKVKGH